MSEREHLYRVPPPPPPLPTTPALSIEERATARLAKIRVLYNNPVFGLSWSEQIATFGYVVGLMLCAIWCIVVSPILFGLSTHAFFGIVVTVFLVPFGACYILYSAESVYCRWFFDANDPRFIGKNTCALNAPIEARVESIWTNPAGQGRADLYARGMAGMGFFTPQLNFEHKQALAVINDLCASKESETWFLGLSDDEKVRAVCIRALFLALLRMKQQ
jgi:hypothetical protein